MPGPKGIRRAWTSSRRSIGTLLSSCRVSRIPRSSAAARAVSCACPAVPTCATGPLIQMARRRRPRCPGHGEQDRRRHSSSGLSGHRDCAGVASERLDVVLYPFQRGQPVEDAAIDASVLDREEALDAQAVVDADKDHAVAGKTFSPVPRTGVATGKKPSAVNPHQHRQPPSAGIGREHVEIEAVVPFNPGLGNQRELLLGLECGGAIGEGVTGPLPASRRARRGEPGLADGGSGVRNPEERSTASLTIAPRTVPCSDFAIGFMATSTPLGACSPWSQR